MGILDYCIQKVRRKLTIKNVVKVGVSLMLPPYVGVAVCLFI